MRSRNKIIKSYDEYLRRYFPKESNKFTSTDNPEQIGNILAKLSLQSISKKLKNIHTTRRCT